MKTPDVCENCTTACAYNSTGTGSCYSYIKHLESRLAQAERERDAAVHDLEELTGRVSSFHLDCDYCKDKDKPVCKNCDWQWRGVCPENTKEDSE